MRYTICSQNIEIFDFLPRSITFTRWEIPENKTQKPMGELGGRLQDGNAKYRRGCTATAGQLAKAFGLESRYMLCVDRSKARVS